jgi:hypothetical protein
MLKGKSALKEVPRIQRFADRPSMEASWRTWWAGKSEITDR